VQTLTAIGEPTRVQILDLLRGRERSVNEIVTAVGMSQPAVSQHLKVLREAGLVRSRADAQRRLYSIDADGFREVDAWLAGFRKFWADELNSLERHLDANP
jgi:DNA-binding transcriptional ArsR family regulator